MKQVQEYFDNFLTKNKCYTTADGFVFHERGDANMHAKSLKSTVVTKHVRDEQPVAEPLVDAIPPPAEPPAAEPLADAIPPAAPPPAADAPPPKADAPVKTPKSAK